MHALRLLARYGTFPLFFLGINGVLLWLLAAEALGLAFAVLGLAIVLMFLIERLIPWQPIWNQDHQDSGRDVLHFLVNTAANHGGLLLLPLLSAAALFPGAWPRHWPYWAQVGVAALVLDLGIAAAHHASHKWSVLWRWHAVHHSAQRLYGFNGLMKHPVHQAIETGSGMLPLLLLGIPPAVATALAFVVAIQLLLQHANADFRIGPLKYLFATAEVHRFHHSNRAAPRLPGEVGLADGDPYPSAYWPQLWRPLHR